MQTSFVPQKTKCFAGMILMISSLLLLANPPLKSQNQEIPDSLYRQLDTATGQSRVMVLQQLISKLSMSDTTMAFN